MSKEYAEKKSKKVTTTSTQATVQKNLAPKATENTTTDNVAKGADSSASIDAVTAPKTLPKGGVNAVKTSNSIPVLSGTKYDKNALVQEARNYNAQKRYMEKGYASEWMPKETQTIPKLEPVLSDAEVKKQYEEIPNYNIFQRMFNKDNREAYEKKQFLSSRYNNIKRQSDLDTLLSYGITEDDLRKENEYNQGAPGGVFNKKYMNRRKELEKEMPEITKKFEKVLKETGVNPYKMAFDYQKEYDEKIAKENPGYASVASIISNPVESTMNVGKQVGRYAVGNPLTKEYSYTDNLRSNLPETKTKLGEIARSGALSYGDMLMAMALGGGNQNLSSAIMGLEKANSTMNDAIERGLTPRQIMGEGLASGATTYATEKAMGLTKIDDIAKAPLESLKNNKGVWKAALEFVGKLGLSGLGEGGQEILEGIADRIVDDWFAKDKSSVNLDIAQRMANNPELSEEEARKEANKEWLTQTAIEGVIGAIGGVLFGGTDITLRNLTGNVNTDNNIPTLEENNVEQATNTDNEDLRKKNVTRDIPKGKIDNNIQANINITNKAASDGFVPSKYQNGIGINGYSRQDMRNLISDSTFIEGVDDYGKFVDNSLKNRKEKGRFYFGRVSEELNNDILASTGIDALNKNIRIRSDEIQHGIDEHGNPQKEEAIGQIAVTPDDIKNIPAVFNKPDSIELSETTDRTGKPAILFSKRIDGTIVTVAGVYDNHNSLDIDTIYIKKASSNGSNGRTNLPKDITSETNNGDEAIDYLSNSIIPRSNENVNTPTVNDLLPMQNEIPSVVDSVNTRYTSEDVNLNELQNAEDVSDIRERNYNETLIEDTDAPEEIKAQFVDNPMLYRQLHNADVSARANEILANNSVEEAYRICDKMITEKNPVAVPLSYNLSKALVEQGDFDSAVTLTEKLGQALTEAGQFTQAVTINMLNDNPMAAMEYMNRMINSMNKEGSEKFGKKWKDFALTESEIEAFSQIEEGDTDAINDLYAQIWARIGQDYPVRAWDKLLEMRRVFLLCNMRTMVRNFTSNLAMLPLRWSGGRATALLESIYQRTNSEYVRTEAKGRVSEQSKKVAKEAEKAYFGDLFDEDAGKYTEARSAIRGAQVFKGTKFDALVDRGATWIANRGINASKTMLTAIDKTTGGAISKFMDVTGIENIDSLMNVINNKTAHHDINPSLLETVRNFTYAMLGEFGDTPFVKANFRQKLASYCEANGITKIEDIPQDAIALCVQEANKATFHDNSKMAQAMEGLRDSFNKVIPGAKLGDLIVTFARTPGNIAARAGEYSPIGAIKGSVEAIKANAGIKNYNQRIADAQSRIDNAKTKSEALKAQKELANYQNVKANTMYQMQQALTLLGQGITGSAALALGIALSRMGFVIGSLSDDKREKQYQQDVQGMQNNSVQIGDLSYSIDFLQPAALPILFGVIVNESLNQQSENFLTSVKQAFVAVGDAWLDSTPMKNVSDMLGGYGTATENIIDTILQLPSSWVPAQVNAITQIGDRTERISYDKSSVGNTIKNSITAKLPGASETLPAKYDLWGREKVRQDTAGQAAFAKLVNPGTTKSTHPTEIDKDILSLYNKTKDVKVLPRYVENSYKIGDENYQLNNQQKSDMQRIMGENSYKLAEKYVKSDIWKDSNDTAKTMALDSMYEFASALAKREVLGVAPSGAQKMLDIYDKEGINGVFKEITESAKYKGYADELGVDTAKAKEIYENVGEEGMQKYARAVRDAEKLGADSIKTDEWNAYNNGDLSKFNTMIRTRVALENSDVPSTEVTQKYIEEHGANAIPKLEEAYDIVSTIPKGKDEYGNQQYYSLTQKMLDVYDEDGADGLRKYKDALGIATSKYGADSITDTEYKDYSHGFTDDFNDSVKYRTILENNDLSNSALNRGYIEEYGEDIIPVLKEAEDAIKSVEKGIDKYGDVTYYNPSEKLIEIYRSGRGKEGVEKYAEIFSDNEIDGNPDNISLKDVIPHLYYKESDMSDADKGYYLYQFLSSNKLTKQYVEGKDNPNYAALYKAYINKKDYAKAINEYKKNN